MPIIGNRRTSYNILLYSSKSIFKEAKEYIYYLYLYLLNKATYFQNI